MMSTWLPLIPDKVVEQIIICDSEGVDLDDLNQLRRFASHNNLTRLSGYLSITPQKHIISMIESFRSNMQPQWEDERPVSQSSISQHIRPYSEAQV